MPSLEKERATAMMLAQRTYLYNLMHVVFGGAPTVDGAEMVFGEQTQEVLGCVRDMMAQDVYAAIGLQKMEADGRSLGACVDEAYACVAKTRGRLAIGATASGILGAAGSVGSVDAEAREGLAFGSLVETLRTDYARLFQVPGDAYVHPWESPYVGKESMLFQESTLDVRNFYHGAGFKLQAEKHFPDDHIAAMMDFLGRMGQSAYEAYADGNDGETARVLETSREFIAKHVLTWVDVFASHVIENDAHAYYAAFAGAMAAFARLDEAWISSVLAKKEDAA